LKKLFSEETVTFLVFFQQIKSSWFEIKVHHSPLIEKSLIKQHHWPFLIEKKTLSLFQLEKGEIGVASGS